MHSCYLGAYTAQGKGGISLLEVDSAGFPRPPRLVAEMENPTWLLKTGEILLAVSETDYYSADGQGGVLAFHIQPDGGLRPAGSAPSGGAGPCHLSLAPRQGLVFAANYGSGTLGVLQLGADGSLELCETLRHSGRGPRPQQEGPHIHCAVPTADETRLFVCDLGTDQVAVYALDSEGKRITRCGEIALPPGSGPRHAVLSADESVLYILCELSNQLFACGLDSGRLSVPLPVADVPPGAFAAASAIRIFAGGTALATSCRGVDCLSFFSLAPDGQPTALRTLPCRHSFPREFAFLPGSDQLALVAYEKGDCLELWDVGREHPVLAQTAAPCPVSICWT